MSPHPCRLALLSLLVACGGGDGGGSSEGTGTDGGSGTETGTPTGGEVAGGSVLVRYDVTDLGDDCMFARKVLQLRAPAPGELVAVGYESPCGSNDNIWLGRVATADGALLASHSHNGVENFRDIGYGAAPAGDGRWAVVGTVDFSNSDPLSGATWLGVFDSQGTADPSVTSTGDARWVAQVPFGFVLVAYGDPGGIVVIGVDAAGAEQWRTTRELAGPYGLVTDAAGNAYVVGFASGDTSDAGLLIKVDPAGAVAWERTYDPDGDEVVAYLVGIAAAGDDVVVGGYEQDRSGPEYLHTGLLAVYSPDGEQTALHRLPDGCDQVEAFAVDAGSGDFIVTCTDDADDTTKVLRLSSTGEERWRAPLDSYTPADVIVVAPDGGIWARVGRLTTEDELREDVGSPGTELEFAL